VGTGLITLLGTGTASAATYTAAQAGIWQVAITVGSAVGLSIYCTAAISGGHLNPAVTVALALFRGFPKSKILPYVAAQVVGATVGALINLLCYSRAIVAFEAAKGLARGSAAAVASAPGCLFFSLGGNLASSTAATIIEALQQAILTFVILCLTAKSNVAVSRTQTCGLVGLTAAVLISVFGPLTCAGFNPARDIGPRIVAACAGWGSHAFKHWWVYTLGPLLGTVAGGLLFSRLYDEEAEAAP